MFRSEYLTDVFRKLKKTFSYQKEYIQSVNSFFASIDNYISKDPRIEQLSIIERVVIPERIITFRIPWADDKGKVHVNIGYRVQYNSAVGPYKGGIRFHSSVNESIIKFLGFEQTLKNALTGLPLGGGKGGADFDPKGKSDLEIMRFCHSFMAELYRYIGPDVDVPAGDIGVGPREIGYLYGYYKKLTNEFTGAFTSKGINYGGSLGRKEATGYGLCYYTQQMLEHFENTNFKDKRVIISGSGNVSIYAAEKVTELGAVVIAMSDSDGYIHSKNGLDIEHIKMLKEDDRERISSYLEKYPDTVYEANSSNIWSVKCDIALPCATENELDIDGARKLVANNVIAVSEGANMPTTAAAINYFLENNILFGPCKAANAGGVATSAFEMSQNAIRLNWRFAEVDKKLHETMKNIFKLTMTTAEDLGYPKDLVSGANVAGFKRVYEAMIAQGLI